MRRIDRISSQGKSLAIFWADGGRSTWPAIWLRDQCRCGQCRHPSGQRLFEIGDLPEHPEIGAATLGDGAIRLAWRDGHASEFDTAWLAAHDLSEEARAARARQPRRWGKEIGNAQPEGDWPTIARDAAAELRWLEAYHAHGFGLLRNVPVQPGQVAAVGDHLGFVRTTNYGKLFDVISVPDPNNLANTSLGLGVHSDNPYRDPTPGVQLLHCLESEAPGGDTLLVDGFAAAEQLRQEAPEHFAMLVRVPASFRFADKEADLNTRTPLISLDDEGRITAVHFNNRSFAGIDVAEELVEPWYAAYRAFAAILKRPEREVIFRLGPGDVVVMQNERALHGRTAFDPNKGRRRLQGCYVDKDGMESRMRVLRRKLAAKQGAAA
jgi:gamma-butyrobetaine dioxygenase